MGIKTYRADAKQGKKNNSDHHPGLEVEGEVPEGIKITNGRLLRRPK